VARALAADPPVLLMDEPFGAVDPITRTRLQTQFLDLQAQLRKTIVFVTHDIDEAATLGDRIAVLSRGGVLEQFAPPSEILGRPRSSFVADFVGADRSVRLLGVTAVAHEDLFFPPTVGPELSMLDARTRTAGADGRWAVVVAGGGALEGWIDLDPAAGGLVADHVQPFGVAVALGAPLRTAFSEMLSHDVQWVPVTSEGRYVGVLTPNRLHAAMRRAAGGQAIESGP
jgi:osmoprotectant transport system ATP-binding protein